jgi:hypothetical protein
VDGLLYGFIAAVILSIFAFVSRRAPKPKVITVTDNLHDSR